MFSCPLSITFYTEWILKRNRFADVLSDAARGCAILGAALLEDNDPAKGLALGAARFL